MAYASWSVVFGEQPSAAKWNILGTNDAAFNAMIQPDGTAVKLLDDAGNEILRSNKTASAVNELTVTNAATANAPQLSATGGDTNIDLKITPKGTGRVVLAGAGVPVNTTVATSETTTSTTYAALATAQAAAVTIGTSGMALVTVSCQMSAGAAGNRGYMGFAVSGATTVAANDNASLAYLSPAGGNFHRGSFTKLVTGLTAGANTFTAQFRTNAGTQTFLDRDISVIPL